MSSTLATTDNVSKEWFKLKNIKNRQMTNLYSVERDKALALYTTHHKAVIGWRKTKKEKER